MSSQHTRPDQSATRTVRQAVLHHAENAARALQSSRPTDIDVHHARKEIKRSRAALAGTTYRRADAALRRAARVLNAARDAGVLVRTLDSLRRRRVVLGQD